MSVSTLLAESSELAFLAKYIDEGLPLPSKLDHRRVWVYLARTVLPSIAQARAAAYPPPFREYKLVETLALATKITDFGLADFEEPEFRRWVQQIAAVDALVRFGDEFVQHFHGEVAELRAARHELDVHQRSLGEAELKLKVLKRQSPSEVRAAQQEESKLSGQLQSKQRELRELQTELTEDLDPQISQLRIEIEETRAEIAVHHSNLELLRPLLARGIRQLPHEIALLDREVDELQQSKHNLEKLREQFCSVLDVLGLLTAELRQLSALKTTVLKLQMDRQVYEGDRVSKTRQRKHQLTLELSAATQQDTKLGGQLQQLEKEIEQVRREFLNSGGNALEETPETPEEDELQTVNARVNVLSEKNRELSLKLRTQKTWLSGMEDLETQGAKIADELDIVKQWLKIYLSEQRKSSEPETRKA